MQILRMQQFMVFLITLTASYLLASDIGTSQQNYKSTLDIPNDSYLVNSDSNLCWAKFTILGDVENGEIYFQNGNEYVFHYDFAIDNLEKFDGYSLEQFDSATLYGQGRQAVLGAVLVPGISGINEYGIQFAGVDEFSKEEILQFFDLVSEHVSGVNNLQPIYMPSYEQKNVANDNADWFNANGIEISAMDRWQTSNIVYSNGWAIGQFKYIPAGQIQQDFIDGVLKPDDILVTDGIPAELPMVAGIITLAPATPNSHVAILAKTYGVPFTFLSNEYNLNQVDDLLGHLGIFYVGESGAIYLFNTDDYSQQRIDDIFALKALPELDIKPMEELGAYSLPLDELVPDDIKYVGGKAANFGLLRKAIPNNSPVGVAFSFDLWNEFNSQVLSNGKTLKQEIAERLQGYSWPPANMSELSSTLYAIREDLFKSDEVTVFSPELQQVILDTLSSDVYGFDQFKKLRFRSSTNVEDSEQFSGAGLYDSYSGCLADDLDADGEGPCQCDAGEVKERGVFRAIRKVYASFYNDNAYLQRLRFGVDENEVGMGLLVHHSFPDEQELANGVGVLSKGSVNRYSLTSQAGAVSVTNPEGDAMPEVANLYQYSSMNWSFLLEQTSSLVTLGDTVLSGEEEYIALCELLEAVADEFSLLTGKTDYQLDYEYKKVAPSGDLIVKQVRQIPEVAEQQGILNFIRPSVNLRSKQGEGDVFTHHRLKFKLETELKDSPESMKADVYVRAANRGQLLTFDGEMDNWQTGIEQWVVDNFADVYDCELILNNNLSPSSLKVYYSSPKKLDGMIFTSEGPKEETYEETVYFESDNIENDQLIELAYENEDGAKVDTSFYYPPSPIGFTIGYTAPLASWNETVITGLTSEPIVLHGDFSQSFKAYHHNFGAKFLFDPRLEPGISQSILNELAASNIELIYAGDGVEGGVETIGNSSETNVAVDLLLVDKFTLKSGGGSKIGKDSFSIKGRSLGVSEQQLRQNGLVISLGNENDEWMSDPNVIKDDGIFYVSMPIGTEKIKNGKYRNIYREGKSFITVTIDLDKDEFQIKGSSLDLRGLCSPIVLGVACDEGGVVSEYYGSALVDESVINGKKRSPIGLLLGQRDTLAMDKYKFKADNGSNKGSLVVSGTISTEIDGIDLSETDIELGWGDNTIVFDREMIAKHKKKAQYTYKNTQAAGKVSAVFDFDKGTYKISIKKSGFDDIEGGDEFYLKFGDYDQSCEIEL